MLTAFKIFIFLLLQHGFSLHADIAMGDSEPRAIAFPLSMPAILHIEGDENVLEETIVICQGIAPAATINREPGNACTPFRADILFDHITEETKVALTRQLVQCVAGRVMIEWEKTTYND